MRTLESGSESRGARLLRELERAYRRLSREQQGSVIEVLRQGCELCLERPEPPLAEAAGAA